MLQVKIYNGYTIILEENLGLFKATNGENDLNEYNLGKLQKRIDDAVKRQEKAKSKKNFPIEVIYMPYKNHEPVMGKITSVAENGDVWFSYVGSDGLPSRNKNSPKGFYKLTESNIAIMDKYTTTKNKCIELNKELRDLGNSLLLTDTYDLSELTKGDD